MRILVGCEYSGRVRDAFIAKGHLALSIDLRPSLNPGLHIRGNVLEHLNGNWDMLIAFPPCTYLTVAALHMNNWDIERRELTESAIQFFAQLLNAPIPRIAIENPPGIISKRIRPPDQYIQPWHYGDPYSKKTGLWLKGLPKLRPNNVNYGPRKSWMANTSKQSRDLTFPGIAREMAEQWSN